MALGNLVALQQTNIKRLLAYSSIGAGRLPARRHRRARSRPTRRARSSCTWWATWSRTWRRSSAIIIYYNWTGREEIDEFKGLAERAPFLALCLTIALFSLSGMPLFAGFATKFILFQAAANNDLLWLAGIAAFFSFVSLYYYLVVIREMYLGEPDEKTRFPTPWFEYGALTVLVAGIFFVGLYPRPIFDAVEDSTDSIFPPGGDLTGAGRRSQP